MSCTWVKDDTDDCPDGFWLQLRYTYNMLDVDAAEKYVTDAYVYVYDANGKYITRIYASQAMLAANGHRVRVEDLPEGDYQFMVWSGAGNSAYAVSGDTQDISNFRLSLSGTGSTLQQELPLLFYGFKSTVHYDDEYAVYNVEMTKDTNLLTCMIVVAGDTATANTDELSIKVVAANATMDGLNQLTGTQKTTYRPYSEDTVTVNDPDFGVLPGRKMGISTMRLTTGDDCRIIIEKKSTEQEVVNISFTEYIAKIGSYYTSIGRPLTVQEYMDRQDFYTVVFYLSDDLDRLLKLQVNNWRVRAVNHLKL